MSTGKSITVSSWRHCTSLNTPSERFCTELISSSNLNFFDSIPIISQYSETERSPCLFSSGRSTCTSRSMWKFSFSALRTSMLGVTVWINVFGGWKVCVPLRIAARFWWGSYSQQWISNSAWMKLLNKNAWTHGKALHNQSLFCLLFQFFCKCRVEFGHHRRSPAYDDGVSLKRSSC